MTEEEARALCARVGAPGTIGRLELLAELLVQENQRQNLVSQASLAQVWVRHLADSVQLLAHVPCETSGLWLDLGTGAGFPGLVVALARPDQPMVLVESRKRRVDFLRQVIACAGLRHCRVEGSRVEVLPTFAATVISARAFAPLPRLLDLSARFSTRETIWLLPKGRSAAQEWAALAPPLRSMFHVKPSLTDCNAFLIIGQGRPVPT